MIASTEHGLPRGWVAKKLYCDSIGIQFIHGVEIYLTAQLEQKVRDNYHTVLLAKNADGVRELNRLITVSSDEGHFYYTNRISFEEFCNLSPNIIKTSACLAGPLNKLDESDPWYLRLLRSYDFLEIQPHNHPDQIALNRKLYTLSEQYGIPLIAGTDTHSSSKYKAECRSVLLRAKNKSYGDEDAFDLSYKTFDELREAFGKQNAIPESAWMEAIENTNRMAESCEPFELDKSIKYPILYGSPENDEQVFVQRVWESLDEKLQNGIIPAEQEAAFREALQEELRVFHKLGMSGFMLSMSDLIRWCKSHDMAIGTARGSVGGSRAAYVTDIIDLNPEQWHTVFSRFCNEDRREIGDIDIDCIESDRPAIFQYIRDRFGESKTARVAAYGTLASKSVVDEVCRAFKEKYPLSLASQIKKEFEENEEAAKQKYKEVFYYYDGLVGTRVSQSVHPAGIIISPVGLAAEYGTFIKDGESCLMLDMDEAHETGLAKYDLLILKTVQVIRDTCKYLGVPYPKTYEINWNDEKVWESMISSPAAIFQFEGSFAFDSLRKFKPHSIFDMSLVTACIRPSGASYRDALLARKPNRNPSELIDKLLDDSLGYLVYQEQIIAFLQQICGLSGSEADTVRRGIGRKKKEVLDAAMPQILEGYCSKSDKPRAEAEAEAKEFLQIIEDASSYMFGYNHSIAYCLLGYFCAYYRYYHPLEFITAFLNDAANDDDIRNGTAYANLAGIQVTMPKWGLSKGDYFFDKEKNVIAKGLNAIKFISETVASELYELSKEKQYVSFVDLLADIDEMTSMNSRQLDILIKIDFFSDFGNQRELLRMVELFEKFKRGRAKQIKKSEVDGTVLEEVVKRHAVGTTKSGGVAKSYTLLDVMALLRDAEKLVRSLHMTDLSDILKVRNFYDVMGYIGYVSGKESDRRKLYVTDLKPLLRKKDNKQFGYSVFTKSIGSGKESRFTLVNRVFEKTPIRAGDIILCKSFDRDGGYFRLLDYERIVS